MIKKPPNSSTSTASTSLLFLSMIVFSCISLETNLFGTLYKQAIFIILGSSFIYMFFEFFILKVHLNQSTGLDMSQTNFSFERSGIKFIGLISTILFFAFSYWLFPEYHRSFYDNYYHFTKLALPCLLLLAIPYFLFVDSKMKEPHDGYWHMGQLVLLNFNIVSWKMVSQHLLAWLVKFFFIPLMFSFMCQDLSYLSQPSSTYFKTPADTFYFFLRILFYFDVCSACCAYIFSLRIIDTHIRSTEFTLLGWICALSCYTPFNLLVGRFYLSYKTPIAFEHLLGNYPIIFWLWGSFILFLTIIYVWATIVFGLRFSNLTNRGIITNGPYRFLKHPAYFSKNLSWWLISMPWIASPVLSDNIRNSIALLGVNFIYYFRAKTEEKHLLSDPDYLYYSQWLDAQNKERALKIDKFFTRKKNELCR